MKILFTGDWHIHSYKDFSSVTEVFWNDDSSTFYSAEELKHLGLEAKDSILINSRLLNCLQALIEIRQYCLDNDIGCVCITGDVFHKRGSVDTIVYNYVMRIMESFEENEIEVHIIPGNHDQVSNDDNPENSVFGLKPYCTVYNYSEQLWCIEGNGEDGAIIVGMPFTKNKALWLEKLEETMKDIQGIKHLEGIPRILLAHLGISGGFVGKGNYALKDAYDAEELHYEDFFDYVMLGHYHKPQRIKGTKNVYYTGSPIQHSFNDEGEDHGFLVVDTKKGAKGIQFLSLGFPKFITVKTKEELEKIDFDSNYVRVQIPSEELDDIQGVIGESTVRVEFQRDYSSEPSDIRLGMSYGEIVQIYAESKEIKPDIGLEILSEAIQQR